MPRILPVCLPITFLLSLAACGASMESTPAASRSGVMLGEMGTAGRARVDGRQVIQQAGLSLVAENLPAVARAADSMATAMGGYVESSEMRGTSDLHMRLRVPAASLTPALDRLASMGRVTRRTLHRQDVTEQVVDMDARLTTLRTLRDRLSAHLAQASAVADLVAVERELARVQGEIDMLEARERALQGRVALAQIQLDADRPRVLGPLGWILNGLATLVEKLFVIR